MFTTNYQDDSGQSRCEQLITQMVGVSL